MYYLAIAALRLLLDDALLSDSGVTAGLDRVEKALTGREGVLEPLGMSKV